MTTLVVLAAGLATRYGGAKQLEPVGPAGERLFDYAVFDALRVGCKRVVFVIREELRDVFESDVVPVWRTRADVRLAMQRLEDAPAEFRAGRTKPWGTAHAVLTGARATDGDILVCNADDWYGFQAYRAVMHALQHDHAGNALAGYPLKGTLSEHGGVSRAICYVNADQLLERIEERTGIARAGDGIADDRGDTLPANALTSMNLWAFGPSFLEQLEPAFHAFVRGAAQDPRAELRIADVVSDLIQADRLSLRVVPVDEAWFGMTYPADLANVKAEIAQRVRNGRYPRNLFTAS